MAVIIKHVSKKGQISYKVSIRKKNTDIFRTFSDEEDAKLFVFYKERLIENMENYEVPLHKRVTLKEMFELKKKEVPEANKRLLNELEYSCAKVTSYLPNKRYFYEFTYEDWEKCVLDLYKSKTWRGSEKNQIDMSVSTLRRIMAMVSSVVSNAIDLGIDVDNLPLKAIQMIINPKLKKINSEIA